MKSAVEMRSGICTKFHKVWLRHSKVNGRDTQAHRQEDHISLLYEIRLIMRCIYLFG
jgi:hypothetical protein